MKRLLFGLPFLFSAVTVLAQATTRFTGSTQRSRRRRYLRRCLHLSSDRHPLLALGGHLVMKDAKRRNSPNATLVTVLTWIPFTWSLV